MKILKTTLIVIFCSSILPAKALHDSKIFITHNCFSDTVKISKNATPDTIKNVLDTTKVIKEKIIPLKLSGLLPSSLEERVYRKSDLNTYDYKYTGNFFSYIPFGFLKDYGSIGQPNEVLINGLGFNNTTFLFNGINLNNRLQNSFDLNLFQSEGIDSIELVPITRGFLYGQSNNSVSVNFISHDFSTKKPYTRLHFYQAPNEEGFFDGIFSSNLSRRLSAFVEGTHQSTDSRYTNSDYGMWMGSVKLRYILSNSINLIGSYSYVKSTAQLNGGVNVNEISKNNPANQFNDILFDEILAPVRFTNRYQKTSMQTFNLRLLGNFLENHPTNLSFYHQSGLIEFRQNESSSGNIQPSAAFISHNNEYKVFGSRLRQDFNFNFINITSISEFERNNYNSPLLIKEVVQSNISSSAKIQIDLPKDIFTISLFGKYLDYDSKSYSGFGGDLVFTIDNYVKLYAGVSNYQKPRSILEENSAAFNNNKKQRNNIFEINGTYTSGYIKIQSGYFNFSSSNAYIPAVIKRDSLISDDAVYFTYRDINLQGLSIKFDLKIWKLLFSTNSSYYFNDSNRKTLSVPEFTSNGGLYYIDTLFNSNLKLKAGINYWSVGKRNQMMTDFERGISSPYIYDMINNQAIFISQTNIPSSFQLDFFLAGKIQDRATLYITYENILNKNFYIVPFYPQQGRIFRLGVAWEFFD